jgi:hypothetical protein
MNTEGKGIYYVKNTENGAWNEISTLFDGVRILSISGLFSKGKAINVYTEKWLTGGTDFMITSDDGIIVREDVDIKVTFIVSKRYATNHNIDESSVYNSFLDYMTNKDIWIKSKYAKRQVHCVATEKTEEKNIKLNRGNNSYIIGEIPLHCLEKPSYAS